MPSMRSILITEVEHAVPSDGQSPAYIDIGNPAKTS